MNTNSILRKIYLYLFSLIGLILLIIGLVKFVDMALETFVFKQADQMERIYEKKPPTMYRDMASKTTKENEDGTLEMKEDITLTEDEKESFNLWIEDYNNWVERNSEFDSVTSRKHREAANNLALIIVGLPLYLYHWKLIKKES